MNLYVVDGGKIQAEGKDGTNGTTPQFKIENDYWFVSYNNGANWTQLGKATGEDGIGGDSMFSGVDYETSTDYVIFTLSNGTQIKLPTWSAFEALQRLCNETNTNLSALQTIVTALQNNDYITSVDPLTENGKVVGYTIKFAKSNPIVIYNGKDGADGVDGNTPVIGVKKDTDGIYYWTLDGEFIVVDGQKIKAQGTDGNNGADGSDGVTPKLEIQEGYWWISYDNIIFVRIRLCTEHIVIVNLVIQNIVFIPDLIGQLKRNVILGIFEVIFQYRNDFIIIFIADKINFLY